MKREASDHPKLWELMDAMDCPKFMAAGVLELLWHFTAKYASRGDVGRFGNRAIARAIGWEQDPDDLVAALVKSGWIDEHPEHRLVVHDWSSHADQAVHSSLYRSVTTFADGSEPQPHKLGKDERARLSEPWEAARLQEGGKNAPKDPPGPQRDPDGDPPGPPPPPPLRQSQSPPSAEYKSAPDGAPPRAARKAKPRGSEAPDDLGDADYQRLARLVEPDRPGLRLDDLEYAWRMVRDWARGKSPPARKVDWVLAAKNAICKGWALEGRQGATHGTNQREPGGRLGRAVRIAAADLGLAALPGRGG